MYVPRHGAPLVDDSAASLQQIGEHPGILTTPARRSGTQRLVEPANSPKGGRSERHVRSDAERRQRVQRALPRAGPRTEDLDAEAAPLAVAAELLEPDLRLGDQFGGDHGARGSDGTWMV